MDLHNPNVIILYFTKVIANSFLTLLAYVYDVIVASNDLLGVQDIMNILHNEFKIKDLGELKYFLGLEVAQASKGISTFQRHYALEVLTDFGFLGCKPSKVPMNSNLHLAKKILLFIED